MILHFYSCVWYQLQRQWYGRNVYLNQHPAKLGTTKLEVFIIGRGLAFTLSSCRVNPRPARTLVWYRNVGQ